MKVVPILPELLHSHAHMYGHCMTTRSDYDCTYCSNGFQCIAAQRDAMFKEFLIAVG